jgi:hypothetical protein
MLTIKTRTNQVGIPFAAFENKTIKDVIDEVKHELGLGEGN